MAKPLNRGRPATPNQADHKQDQKDDEQDPRDLRRGASDPGQSQDSGNEPND